MKPVVGPAAAWFCTILSIFAVVILSVIALLFKGNHESMMGSINDPENGAAVASTVFGAVIVYLCFFGFCGLQIWVNQQQSRAMRLLPNRTYTCPSDVWDLSSQRLVSAKSLAECSFMRACLESLRSIYYVQEFQF